MSDIQDLITAIIDNEGRTYENVKHDRGGPTKFGITLGRLREWRNNPKLTWEAVRDLTETEAREIYVDRYYFQPKIDRLPDFLEHVVMDWFTTSGTWATKGLQRTLRGFGFPCDVDGKIGPQTIRMTYELAAKVDKATIINAYNFERKRFYRAIVTSNESQRKFLRGWLNRAAKFDIKEKTNVA